MNFKEYIQEDSEDVTTKSDICELIDMLSYDFGEENVDYDEIMEVLLDYMKDEYDIEDDEDIEEAKWFDDDKATMKRKRKNQSLVAKKRLAAQAKKYYKRNKKKLQKKQKKYRKKVKSGKIKPRTHDRFKRDTNV
jgi:hypothetical protein